MTTYQQIAPTPARTGGIDVAAWALIALIVAIICGGAGWAIARQDSPSLSTVAREAELATREGQMRGESAGYSEGAQLGRREASLKTRSMVASERRTAGREGYDAGYYQGRVRAGDPDAFLSSSAGAGGAYPAAGYEDVLASGLFGGDAPGYSDSAYDSMGFGVGASTPYLGSTSRSTSIGDDFGGLGY